MGGEGLQTEKEKGMPRVAHITGCAPDGVRKDMAVKTDALN